MTPLQSVSNYNNFYEFTTNKEGVAAAAAGFVSKPWQVAVGGMAHKPRVFDLDELMKAMPLEERVYRMRCVEGWSMVIPWSGFPLAKLLERVEPMGGVEYVAFETLLDPVRMPGQKGNVLAWPYVEGLRIDEAMHPLTLLAVGLYGHELPAQNGAPLRLVVPWKYGFKGIKSIVKITLMSTRPATTWNMSAPHEYGFFSNVNPEVDHPRWSQATEQRIGESVVGRHSCSTAMARRWPISTRVWTCGQTSEAGGRDEGHSIRQIHRAPQLRRAGDHPRLGRLAGPTRRQPGQLRHPEASGRSCSTATPSSWPSLHGDGPAGQLPRRARRA